MTPPAITTKHVLKKISPLPLGKILGILYGIMGLLFVPFCFIMTLSSLHMHGGQRAGMIVLGLFLSILFPFFYAAMGFVFGILGALLYNVLASWIGGIEVEVE